MKNIYNFLETIFWGAFKKRRDKHWAGGKNSQDKTESF